MQHIAHMCPFFPPSIALALNIFAVCFQLELMSALVTFFMLIEDNRLIFTQYYNCTNHYTTKVPLGMNEPASNTFTKHREAP